MTFEEWWMSRPDDVRRMNGSCCVSAAQTAWNAATDQLREVIAEQIEQIAEQRRYIDQADAWCAVCNTVVEIDSKWFSRSENNGLTGQESVVKFIQEKSKSTDEIKQLKEEIESLKRELLNKSS